MSQFKCPIDYVPLQQVTAANLNSHVNDATAEPGLVNEQDAIPAALESTDTVLGYDNSTGELVKIDAPKFTSAGFPVTTNQITGNAGSDVVINPAAGQKVDINSALEANSLSVSGRIETSSTGAMKIPTGTTAQRPASPVLGDIRYNTTDNRTEVYDGTVWKAMGTNPFEATGGTVTTADLWRTHVFTSTGTFNIGNTDGDVEVLVVGGGGGGQSGAYSSGYLGQSGGGGGQVVYRSTFSVTRNTAMLVTVGLGGEATTVANGTGFSGGTSTFGSLIALGGQGGYGSVAGIGGTSGNGFAGGSGTGTGGFYSSGGGGGGAAEAGWFGGSAIAGASAYVNSDSRGGIGIGSSISGTYRIYGCGGGGMPTRQGNSITTTLGASGVVRGDTSITATNPLANSGNGGHGNGGNGAAGIVIIKYRYNPVL